MQFTVFDNDGKFAQPGGISAEIERGYCVVAEYLHVLDRAQARGLEQAPRAALLEKRRAAGTDRIDADIPARRLSSSGRRVRVRHCDTQSGGLQRQREARAHQTGADDNYIEIHDYRPLRQEGAV